MKTRIAILALIISVTVCRLCWANDIDALAAEGYNAVAVTKVIGEYRGCTASQALRFTDGSVFSCSTFSYDNAQYMPDVTIYKNKEGLVRILINGKVFRGSFLEPNDNGGR